MKINSTLSNNISLFRRSQPDLGRLANQTTKSIISLNPSKSPLSLPYSIFIFSILYFPFSTRFNSSNFLSNKSHLLLPLLHLVPCPRLKKNNKIYNFRSVVGQGGDIVKDPNPFYFIFFFEEKELD